MRLNFYKMGPLYGMFFGYPAFKIYTYIYFCFQRKAMLNVIVWHLKVCVKMARSRLSVIFSQTRREVLIQKRHFIQKLC